MVTREVAPGPGRIYPLATSPHTWVPRPRLLRALRGADPAPNSRVVLVSAPAGAGKSVLARQWLEVDEREHLELPLVARLDEPTALTRFLVRVLEGIGPPALALRSGVSATEPGFSTIVLPALAGLAASRAADYLMVVDDVHLLRNPQCHEVLLTVCEAVPEGSQVVLLSREEAPAWLSRARAEGRLSELTGTDLRFDADEAAEMFHRMEVPRRSPDVGDIVEQTEGWAVGIFLTGLALRRHDQSTPYVVSEGNWDSHRFIADYIVTQVLPPLDPELRSFAVRTSVLDELRPELCDALLERDDSVSLLARLRAQLQLVIPLDAAGTRLRYHHLIGDALLAELSRQSPAEVPVLHARAARWFADTGDLDAAVHHAKAAQDLRAVGHLVWSGTAACVGSGENDRLAFWLADLTDHEIARDPWLSLAAAWLAMQSGEIDRMDRWILRAQAHAGGDWKVRADRDPYSAALAVLVAIVGRVDLLESAVLCWAALRGLPVESPFRAAALFIRGVALTLVREVEEGRQCLVEAERLARVLDVPIIQADARSWLGVLAVTAGDPAAAHRLISGAQDVIRDRHLDRLASAAHCITAQAWVQASHGDRNATTTLATARRLTTLIGDTVPWFSVCGRLIQARAAVSLGEAALARQLITEARARMTPDLRDSMARDLLDDTEHALSLVTVDGVPAPALTAAEMRVLQFLPSHLQLHEIGEHLFVSSNTVKTHVMAIHRKLGVTSRAQAVARARQLGILEVPSQN